MSNPLAEAVKERKISPRKAKQVQDEYANLPDSLQDKYVDAVIAILNAGGDSTHLDVVRKRITKK
jgi:hypothetical protein